MFIILFFLSFFINLFFIKIKPRFSLDKAVGVQKIHFNPVPRLGGLGIYTSFLFFSIYKYILDNDIFYLYLFISTLPIFIGGILEDITKKISPKNRLLFALLSALVMIYLFNIYIYKLDLILVDNILELLPIAYLFTIFAIIGISNAYNIIDGFNGLTSGIALLVFSSFVYISYIKQDEFIFSISLAMIFSILGFFILNYPFGKIFLGDAGAYFLGFFIGFISIYLVFKYEDISPWYPLLLSIYPIFETIYSIYRRKFIHNTGLTEPDNYHLHTLVYKELSKALNIQNKNILNSLVFPVLVTFFSPFLILANIYWNNSLILIILSILFIIIYIFIYTYLVTRLKFKAMKEE